MPLAADDQLKKLYNTSEDNEGAVTCRINSWVGGHSLVPK